MLASFVRQVLISFFLMLIASKLSSQNKPYQRDYLAKSPEVANFDKYGDIAVSLFTGSANINIPICSARDLDDNI